MKQPRIAIYYHTNFGRNDGSPLYWWNVMKNKMGLDVTHLAPQGDTRSFGKFDYHIWVDYGEDGLPVDHEWRIPEDGGKTIYVVSDAHLDNGYRFNKAKKFDYVFFNQKRFLDEFYQFNRQGDETGYELLQPKMLWLPHAADPQAYPKFEIAKKYDVAFIGHLQDVKNHNGFTRVDFLDRMFREFPNFYFGTRNPQKPEVNMFEDASKKFGMSKVCLNVSIKDDINMRVFEILSSGSFQLTNSLPTLGELFEDGKHLVTYNSLDDAVEKAKYYLEHDEEREQIAKAGHDEFMRLHTYEHRVRKMFKTIGVEV